MLSTSLPVHDSTSIRVQGLARYEAAVLTRQEDKAGRNLTWLTRSAHWRGERVLCLIIHGCCNQWSPDRSGADSVDSNALAADLIRKTPGECYDGPLCGCVVKQIRSTNVGVD